MAIALFYLSKNPGEGRSEIKLADGRIVGYVRAELAPEDCDLSDALDFDDAREDEGLMNSHDVEVQSA